MSFDAAAFGPITLNHLPPFAQRLRHAVHVETRMGRVRRTMDERWARALRAKGIDIDEADGAGGKRAHDGKRHTDITGTGRRSETQSRQHEKMDRGQKQKKKHQEMEL